MVISWPVVGIVRIVGLAPVVSNQNEKTQTIDVGLVYPTVVISPAFWWSGGSRDPDLMASFVDVGRVILQLNCSHVFHPNKNLPNAICQTTPKSFRSICRSSLLHFGGCFELWLLYRWNVHENWWEIIGSELARCTSNHREGNFGHAEKVGDSFCLFVGHQGWMLSVFFGGGRGLIRLWIICL